MHWRLVSEIIAYVIPAEKSVYLAATEKKQYQVGVIKLIGNNRSYQELRLYENQFDLKFGGGPDTIELYIRCSELPGDWYRVANFWKPGLWSLLEGHVIDNGVPKVESQFEVIFDEDLPYVSFIEPSMKNFKSCFEEMKRKMNCEMCKKTSKWIIGHRYDSYTESVYPLATVRLRKTSLTNSEYLTDLDKMPEVMIYVGELGDEKTVGEVLKTRSFGEGPTDLKISFKAKSMVDAGEVLVNDFSGEIKDYWLPIYDNARDSGKSLKEVLDTFSVINDPEVSVSLPKSEIEELTEEVMETVLIGAWNLDNTRKDLAVGDKISEKENIERAIKLFTGSGIKDTNFLKSLYYPKLYDELGIDLTKIAEEAVHNVAGIRMPVNFDYYLKYLDYWKNPLRINLESNSSRQRVKSTNYKLDVVTLKDLYGETELRDTIIECANKVRSNLGLGASDYSVVNVGSKKEPKEYIICKLTLEDIIKLKKGVSGLSENLKSEIMKNHFVWVQIIYDKDGVLT